MFKVLFPNDFEAMSWKACDLKIQFIGHFFQEKKSVLRVCNDFTVDEINLQISSCVRKLFTLVLTRSTMYFLHRRLVGTWYRWYWYVILL